jgi:hypothetical protein
MRGYKTKIRGGLIRLFHTTHVDYIDRIMRDGFRDNATVTGVTILRNFSPRVWFADVPVIDDKLFDAVGMFNFDAERQAFIAVDICLPVPGIQLIAVDDTWPGIQYWGPASIWNGFPRKRIELDDIIKLRLASDPKLRPMREWIARRPDPDDPYGTSFHQRVEKILMKHPELCEAP